MAVYSEQVMEHFRNPRNVGVIEDADGVGEVGNPICGDMMTFYIKVKDNYLEDIKYQTFGCGAAIAVSSMVSEMAKGKTLDEAMEISNEVVAEALGGLPVQKMHCSNLGAEALRKAIEDYQTRRQAGVVNPERPATILKKAKEPCICPYCDKPISPADPYCKPCQVKIKVCPKCKKGVAPDAKTCPSCDTRL